MGRKAKRPNRQRTAKKNEWVCASCGLYAGVDNVLATHVEEGIEVERRYCQFCALDHCPELIEEEESEDDD